MNEVGGIEHARGPCSWDACGKDGRLVGFGCPGFRPIFACEVHDPRAGEACVGFRHHRVARRVGLRDLAQATGWGSVRISDIDRGKYRMDRLELARWWAMVLTLAEEAYAR